MMLWMGMLHCQMDIVLRQSISRLNWSSLSRWWMLVTKQTIYYCIVISWQRSLEKILRTKPMIYYPVSCLMPNGVGRISFFRRKN
ncbi:hypothetical protein E9993_15960 [Labilibacter sediminis]|nr:hypothetical protein E9993_15960 [Labilibacter sediminis]